MATKINCVKCGVDTSYTSETPISSKTRSLTADENDERLRLHFCPVCWQKLVVDNEDLL